MDAVTPECLGSLIAAYEHKTYFLAVLLGVNAFDQWGVELGKEIAATIEPLLRTGAASIDSDALDPATRQAAMAWHQANEKQDVKRQSAPIVPRFLPSSGPHRRETPR